MVKLCYFMHKNVNDKGEMFCSFRFHSQKNSDYLYVSWLLTVQYFMYDHTCIKMYMIRETYFYDKLVVLELLLEKQVLNLKKVFYEKNLENFNL